MLGLQYFLLFAIPRANCNATKNKKWRVLNVEQGLFLPAFADGSDWTGEEAVETEMVVRGSGGAVLFPMKDLALSRHCSATFNIRSPSTATISLSSMENRKHSFQPTYCMLA